MTTTDDDVAALREASREAHEAIRDLRAVLKEMREMRECIPDLMGAAFEEHAAAEVKAGLERYKSAIEHHIEHATKRVDDRFKELCDILLGEDRRSRLRGDLPLKVYAERMAAARDGEL